MDQNIFVILKFCCWNTACGLNYAKILVGAKGLEPLIPCSQSRCANQTALRPDPFIGGDGGIRTRISRIWSLVKTGLLIWSRRSDSNRHLPVYETDALPVKLRRRGFGGRARTCISRIWSPVFFRLNYAEAKIWWRRRELNPRPEWFLAFGFYVRSPSCFSGG